MYGWTKAVWAGIAARGACNSGGRRGWVEGDERVVTYRDRIGTAYQVEIGEEGEHAEKDDRARKSAVLARYCSVRMCG